MCFSFFFSSFLWKRGGLGLILVSLPKIEIFAIKMKRLPLPRDLNLNELLEELASRTAGCSGAEIENLCREGAMRALRADIHSLILDPRYLLEMATSHGNVRS